MAAPPVTAPASLARRLAGGVVVLGATFFGGLLAGSGVVRSAYGAGDDAYAGFDTLARVLGTIEAQYLEERSTGALLESATRGLVSDLDEHSTWMDADAWSRLQSSAEGEVDSAGLTLGDTAGAVRVLAVAPRGPAELAGVVVGDHLTHVRDAPVANAEAAAAALAGERGDAVAVTLERDGAATTRTIVLDTVEEQVVFAERQAEGVRVSIRHFSRSTASQLDRALDEVGLTPDDALVLDLRDNPGGLMDQAVAVVDRFVGDGVVVETRGRGGATLTTDRSTTSADDLDNRVVVLVNEQTASAAEVVSGALQDRDRATLVGRQTYGKGTVQQVFPLEDGSALKLTRARYHLPSGRALTDREGLDPDVVVPPAPSEARAALLRAVADAPLDDEARAALRATIDAVAPLGAPGDPIAEAGWAALRE